MTTTEESSARSITFYDSYTPALTGGKYTITVHQEVLDSAGDQLSGDGDDFPATTQHFEVHAPRFSLGPGFVHAVHPPPGSVGNYDNLLAHVSLSRPMLPWEQELADGLDGQDSSHHRVPWLALLLFAEGELPHDPYAQGVVDTSRTVEELLTPGLDPSVQGPAIDLDTVVAEALKSTCQTIDVPSDVFMAVVPTTEEVRYLTHVREVAEPPVRRTVTRDLTDLGQYSVVVANRFARTHGNYAAHLVSLEGFLKYLKPNPDGTRTKPDKGTVRLVSLRSWSFTSHPDSGGHFSNLVARLAEPGVHNPSGLSLRLPQPAVRAAKRPGHGSENSQLTPDAEVSNRLKWGYVPLSYRTADGEATVSWYRGPLTPVPPPSTFPRVQLDNVMRVAPTRGSEPEGNKSSEELLVYLKDWGIFDLSYASAWTLGRLVALSHAQARTTVTRLWQQARITAHRTLSRIALPAGISGLDAAELVTPQALAEHAPAVKRFHTLLDSGLAQHLSRDPVQRAGAPTAGSTVRSESAQARTHRVRALLERGEVRAVLAQELAEKAEPAADVMEALYTLELVPFDHLVADMRMLPSESLRFFYVDPTWVAAMVQGFVSAGVSTSLDQALLEPVVAAVTAHLDSRAAAGAPPVAGMLVRSRLVQNWPGTIIDVVDENGAPVEFVRREYLAPDLLLCLFGRAPQTITFSEPHQDLYLGALVEENGFWLDLRYLDNNGHAMGAPQRDPNDPNQVRRFPESDDGQGLLAFLRVTPPGAGLPEVLDVAKVLPALAASLHLEGGISPAQFAIELIKSPARQFFIQP